MNTFTDRAEELASLERSFDGDGASLYVLYGRRRLGKTTLLRRFAEGRPGVYHMADRSAERDSIHLLARSIAAGLSDPAFADPEYRTFEDLLTAFDRARLPTKCYLILDEYQYLCEVQPALSSILQRHWDATWRTAPLMVVLCGSVVSMMYNETLARSSPLYGRRTGQWLLEPMRFKDVCAFHGSLDPVTQLELWALTGGVPRYAELTSSCVSLSDALRTSVLAKDGPLYAEARFLLQDEVSTPNVYWSILRAVSSGANRISEIAGRVGVPANQLTRYLGALSDLGLVTREVPVTERAPEKSKRGLYRLDDAFLRLWFGCVVSFESLLEFGRIDQVETLMQERLARQVAWAFERACRQHAEDELLQLGGVKVGRFWDRHAEVDVVAVDEDGRVVLAGECKWSNRRVGLEVGKALEQKVQTLWPDRAGQIRLALFSAQGFTPPVETWARANGTWLVSAKEMV
jgi:AAA+ ATPase superfamily predicted ATPase